MKKVILLLAALCCAVLVFNSQAQSGTPGAAGGFNVLTADSNANISDMNTTFTTSPAIAVGQAVKFQPQNAGWRLEHILIMASDGWNSSVKTFPTPLPFTIEIRDKDLNLLYHYADTQLPYFTHPDLITMADIEVPAMPMSGEFYVCFYGYSLVWLLTEMQNATGNSFYYVRPTGQLAPAELQLQNNSTLPVNWIIRVAGK